MCAVGQTENEFLSEKICVRSVRPTLKCVKQKKRCLLTRPSAFVIDSKQIFKYHHSISAIQMTETEILRSHSFFVNFLTIKSS